MFRGHMPALTLFVFGIGIGIGLCWSSGFIPLSYSPAKSGTLSVEVARREPLPAPNDSISDAARRLAIEAANEERDVVAQQTEPEVDASPIVTASSRQSVDRSSTASERRTADSSVDEFEGSNAAENRPGPPIRLRRAAAKMDPSQGVRETAREKARIKAAAYQDPSTTESDNRELRTETRTEEQSLKERLAAAEDKLAAGETLVAHREFSKLYWDHKEFRPQLQEIIDSTARAIFFDAKPHYVDPYEVEPGNQLRVIAKKYQLSAEYLAKLNRVDPRRIQIGQKLKVMKGPFGAVVDLKEFALTVHLQGYYVKRYEVGIGKDSSSPLGKFAVLDKMENPQYTDSRTGKVIEGNDPQNPLGKRWISLGNSYGIHGTIDPDSIGKAESRGCIRMRDRDIIEVYDFLVKGSEVMLRE
ncbi:L,D-transpeptidase family protein [Schlesneria paludicola]|uniref:L,D-transpeptidase family protein n=1 Tax=Schlesneria paludicola TaxID=360056 RepID=UPI00029A48A2|nr:L,D-transpeptidase family protein [Schlesneria paludicola]